MKNLSLIVGAALLTLSASALATPIAYNDASSRPATIGASPAPEKSLQEIVDGIFDTPSIDVANDQSTAAAWTGTDLSNSTAFSIDFLTGGNGSLFIYSLMDFTKYYDLGLGGTSSLSGGVRTTDPLDRAQSSFSISDSGFLTVNGTIVDNGWTDLFGFYYQTGDNKSFTQDSRNTNGAVKALAFELPTLDFEYTVMVNTTFGVVPVTESGSTNGQDDWLIAFEDGGDNDFNDAIFLFKDIAKVSSPSVIALFGLGIFGMGYLARRRN